VYAAQNGIDIDEDSPIAASSFYSETKIAAEQLVREVGDSRLTVVIVRPCLIYGPGTRFNLERMMRAIDMGYYLHVAGLRPTRSFLSVENAARALQHLALGSTSGTFNLADRRPWSTVEFANELADRMKRPRPRAVPSSLLYGAAAVGSAAQRLGIRLPISRDSISKLTSDFSLSTSRLASCGFEWDCNDGLLRQEMVDHYLRGRNASPNAGN
jgi:nucleoside-diphosphate-sugar epimerase